MGGCHSIGGLISNFLTVFGRQRVNFFFFFFTVFGRQRVNFEFFTVFGRQRVNFPNF